MSEHFPLLVFPQKRTLAPERRPAFPPSKPHFPAHNTQITRLNSQLNALQQSFTQYQTAIADTLSGMEPETVLVLEIAGSIDDFKQAVDTAGAGMAG